MADFQYLGACDECGALLLHPHRHEDACPRIRPEPAPPVWESGRTIADRAWLAAIMLRHNYRPRTNTSGACKCGLDPITELDWADHAAEVVYRALAHRD